MVWKMLPENVQENISAKNCAKKTVRKFFSQVFFCTFTRTFSCKFLAGLWSRERSELLPAQQTRSLFSRCQRGCKAPTRPSSSLRSLHLWPAGPWTSGNFVDLIPLETSTSPSVPLRDQIQILNICLNLNIPCTVVSFWRDSMPKHCRQKINLCEGGISQKSRDTCWRPPFFYMHLLSKDDINSSNF